MTAVRPPARFGGLVFDGDLVTRVHREAADRRGLDQRRLHRVRACASSTTSTGDDTSLEADALERLAADGQLAAYRHDGFWQCMDTLRDKRLLEALWESGERPVEGVVTQRVLARPADARHRRDRARRRLAGAAPGRRAGRTSSASCATGCPQSELVRDGLLDRVTRRSRRRPRSGAARARARRVRDRHRLPPRGADDRRHREPQPGLDVRDEHRPAPGRCSRPAGAARPCKQIVLASSDKAYGDHETLPYDEDDAAPGPAPVRRQQVVRRPDRAGLRDDLRPAGRDHALRQLLRRRRPELEPDRARHDPLGAARRAAGDPLRRARSCATTSTSRTALPPT